MNTNPSSIANLRSIATNTQDPCRIQIVRNVSVAGLSAELDLKVRAACSTLIEQCFDIRVSQWIGVRGHLLIADIDDRFGRYAVDLAQRRGLAVLSFSRNTANESMMNPGSATALPANAPTAQIAQAMMALLKSPPPFGSSAGSAVRAASAPVEAPKVHAAKVADTAGFLRVGSDAALTQKNIHASCTPFQVWMVPSASLVVAKSHSDLIAARERILDENWNFRAVRMVDMPDNARTGMDAFFLDAYSRVAERLPVFPLNMYQLRCWPDLGALTKMPEAMQLAAVLVKQGIWSAELAQRAKTTPAQANTFLWAMHTCGLLQSAGRQDITTAAKRSVGAGFLKRLATRLGISY